MKRILLALVAMAVATGALADPIEERQALMKRNGAALGKLAPMVKGEQDFDAAAAQAALEALREDGKALNNEALWPEGSHEGDTEASPAIWQDWDGFKAALDKFESDTTAAAEAAPQDLDTLKTHFSAIGANCGGCHRAFRT